MENIDEEPITHGPIARIRPPSIANLHSFLIKDASGYARDISWGKIVAASNMLIVDLRKKYSEIPDATAEALGDQLFGPFRLERSAFGSTEREDLKEISARIQHNLVHGIMYAGSREADPVYTDVIYKTMCVYDKLANSLTGESTGLKGFWSGVKSELALVRALYRRGYKVRLPDYTQDPYEVSDEENEVLNWDVRHGIDMVVVSPGEFVLLLDAKGRTRDKNGDIMVAADVQALNMRNDTPDDILMQYQDLFNRGLGKRMRVIIPSGSHFLSGLEYEDRATDARSAISKFAVSRNEDDIIYKMNLRRKMPGIDRVA